MAEALAGWRVEGLWGPAGQGSGGEEGGNFTLVIGNYLRSWTQRDMTRGRPWASGCIMGIGICG